MEQEKESTFRVTDKRSAYQEHPAEEEKISAADTAETKEPPPRQDPTIQPQETILGGGNEASPVPEANFVNLIFSLYAHAQICLGIVPDPMTQQTQKDLTQAKYNIDMLGLLKEKTRGNLTQEEEHALEQMLYEVRMAYVQAGR